MQNILVVKLSAIGDVIHALPVSYAIKEEYPHSHLTWVAEPAAAAILEGNPYIDELVIFEKSKFKSIRGFMENYPSLKTRLRARSYDVSLDLQGLFKSAAIAYVAGAKGRLGTANMRELSDKISRPVTGANANGHIVERYLDVARAIGCKTKKAVFPLVVSERDQELAGKIMEQAGAKLSNPYAVLVIGGNWPNKRWPSEYWAHLADELYNLGLVPVVVGGGAVDEANSMEIASAMEIPPVNLVGRTNLKQLGYLLSKAKVVIGGDTGPCHLAAGLGTKTVMLMGPTDAVRNGPYGQLDNAIEVSRDCRYCWKRACPKGWDCLEVIAVETVLAKVKAVLD